MSLLFLNLVHSMETTCQRAWHVRLVASRASWRSSAHNGGVADIPTWRCAPQRRHAHSTGVVHTSGDTALTPAGVACIPAERRPPPMPSPVPRQVERTTGDAARTPSGVARTWRSHPGGDACSTYTPHRTCDHLLGTVLIMNSTGVSSLYIPSYS